MAHFDPPLIQDNPNGWGPCTVPEKFKDMPYQPFSKGDRLGKVLVLFSSKKLFWPYVYAQAARFHAVPGGTLNFACYIGFWRG